MNTDKVDQELRALKKERDALKQQLAQAGDGVEAEKLNQQLEALDNELRQKDNDSYRRQHAVFSE